MVSSHGRYHCWQVSAGGTRHIKRRKRNVDGTYGDDDSYHSSQDEAGKTRRQKRRRQQKEKLAQGGRNVGSDSDYSYQSVVSAGGRRHVKRRRKRAGGTYSTEESYHSDQDADGKVIQDVFNSHHPNPFPSVHIPGYCAPTNNIWPAVWTFIPIAISRIQLVIS